MNTETYESLLGGVEAAVESMAEKASETIDKEVADQVVEEVKKPKQKAKAKKSITAEMDLIEAASFTIENLSDEEARSELEVKLTTADQTYFEIGGLLQKINLEGWYDQYGFASFKEFVIEETNLEYRKALYWIKIYDVLTKMGMKWDDVKDIQWTKLRELAARVLEVGMPDEEVQEWLQRARDLTVVSLIEAIKSWQAKKDGEEVEITEVEPETVSTMTFKVHEDQKEIIEAAVDAAMADKNTDAKSVGLDHICSGYLAGGSLSPPAPQKDLKTMMREAGYMKIFEIFEELWPTLDITVTCDELPEQ